VDKERERERESLCHHLKKRESPHHPILEKEKTSIVWWEREREREREKVERVWILGKIGES